ncbi:glycoside hydrolase family 99-like domain-containing protein [Halosimplex halophilum]|uniref:glycoside hydrolase family 99-like domain-containing protein n=1 Tax=Halosimplex halophilum TaxID=2559572 RepID=UPI001435604A|nr:glycoside hydrolase family 99-like domain-containing protein [Halosimplex halophilum]
MSRYLDRRGFLVGSACALGGCASLPGLGDSGIEKTPGTQVPRDVPRTDATAERDVTVAAHYYPWYGETRHWQGSYEGTPALGRYNSRADAVVEQHVAWARQAGIDAFSMSWWGPDSWEDTTIREHFLPSADGFPFFVLYEMTGRLQADDDGVIDFDRDGNRAQLRADFEYLAETYFGEASYRSVDGRPIVFVYHPGTLNLAGAYGEALADARAAIDADPFLIGDLAGWFPLVYLQPEWVEQFDALSAYDWFDPSSIGFDFVADESFDHFRNRVEDHFLQWQLIAEDTDTAFVPTTMPGFDKGHDDPDPSTILTRSPERFRELCSLTADYLDPDLRMAFVTTFNEWHEYSAVEPGEAFGETYLDITASTLATAPETRTDLDAFGRVDLSFDDAVTTPRRLCLWVEAAHLVADDDTVLRAYDVGDPVREPVFTRGAFPVEDADGTTFRWFGGPTETTRIYADADLLDRADQLVVRARPATTPLTTTVAVDGDETDERTLRDGSPSRHTFSLGDG